MQEEKILIERIKKGDDEAMEAVVKTYKRKLYNLAYDLTNNNADAEDLVQDVFFKAFSQIHKFRGESALGTWLHRITVNQYLDIKKRKSFMILKHREEISESSEGICPPSGHNPATDFENQEISDHINSALSKLSRREKHVFIFRHYNECQLNEIAEILKISEGTVKSLLFRALKKMRKELAYYSEANYVKERS